MPTTLVHTAPKSNLRKIKPRASGAKPAPKRKHEFSGAAAATEPDTPIALTQGTKQDRVLALLNRPEGTSFDEMMLATTWQAYSVRGFLSGTVKKKLG